MCQYALCEWVFVAIKHPFRLIKRDIRHTEIVKDGIKRLANVPKCHRAVVRIPLGDQHMAVEPAHLGDREDADAAERTVATGRTSPCAMYA